jgi:hypothetical protein
MIHFRCWYCNKRFAIPEKRVGDRITCTCKNPLRVPSRDNGRCRIRTPVDWLVEIVAYGGGGAFLGVMLALVILAKFRFLFWWSARYDLVGAWSLFLVLGLAGFAAGVFCGEVGVNWIGRMIRDQEES